MGLMLNFARPSPSPQSASAGRPHPSHHRSKPLCAAGTLGTQPSVRLCLFDRWNDLSVEGEKLKLERVCETARRIW
jgi:hypothetical protein